MDDGEGSRSKRTRRPPKQFQGTISWDQVEQIEKSNEQADRSNGRIPASMNYDEDQGEQSNGDDSDDALRYNLEEPADSSMDEWQEGDGSTSDEFVPDPSSSSKRRHDNEQGRVSGIGRISNVYADSDSGEEFASSEENDIDAVPQDDTTPIQDSALQRNEMTTMERLDRARKRRWLPPAGHGGMENPEAWKEAGERNRAHQMALRDAEKDRDLQVEVEGMELQNLAEAFAGEGIEASVEQVERWQSALHRQDKEPSEAEELDEAAFEQDMRGAIGFKRKTLRDQRTGAVSRPMREHNYSAPVRALLTEANLAYIGSDLPGTIAKLKEVIKLEPAVRSAWATLALCFNEIKEPERALQCRIMEAHLTFRPITLWGDLARSSLDLGYNEQAVYCLSKAISSSREKDRVDVIDIMWERGQLLENINEPRRAMYSYLQMLQYRPHNQSIIRQLIPLLFQMNMLDRAIKILQQCEEWNIAAFPDPLLDPAMIDENLAPDVRNTYESSEVVTLADLLLRANRPQEALHTIRRGARWLDGRGSQEFWNDILVDDREFDESREEGLREGNYGRRVELAPVYYLDPEFRFQLAVARARMGDAEEAERHFAIWMRDAHISDHLEHYSDMAEEYARLGAMRDDDESEAQYWYDRALHYTKQTIHERQYSPEYGDDGEAMIADYKRAAACHIGLGEAAMAIDWLKEVIQYDSDDFESKLRLAEAYAETGDRQMALNLVTDVIQSKREKQRLAQRQGTEPVNDETYAQSMSFFAEMQRKTISTGEGASKQTIREQRKEMEKIREMESNMAWKEMKQREDKVFVHRWWSVDVDLSGDPRKRQYGDRESSRAKEERFGHVSQWLSDAERLVTMYENTPQLYPRDRTKKFSGVLRTKRKKTDMVENQATAILARLGDDMLEDRDGKIQIETSSFRGIKLDDWVDLIMRYAFVLTKVGEYAAAEKVIRQTIRSSVIWSDEQRKMSMQMCLASCALYAHDYGTLVVQLKNLTYEYQFHNEPLRILLTTANATGYSTIQAYSMPNNLKTFLRRSRIHEGIVQGVKTGYHPIFKRWVVEDKLFEPATRDDEDEAEVAEVADTENAAAEGEEDVEEARLGNTYAERADDLDTEAAQDQADATSKNLTKGKAQDIWKDLQHDPRIDHAKSTPPTRYNPANDMFYAGLLLASNTGIPSMGYWTRVFARQQSDPLICLTAAVACFGRAQNRQVDNRHQVIVQAFAYLDHYRQLRWSLNQSKSEVSYNLGRGFHRLGLYQLAVPHYREVLEMKEEEHRPKSKKAAATSTKTSTIRQPGFTAWPEAAYNLSLVYLASGNPVLANYIVERYLRV